MPEEPKERRSVSQDEVRFYMTHGVTSVIHNATVTEAAQTMFDTRQGSVLVEQNGTYIGIVTEGDISKRVIAQIEKPIEVRVEEIMSQPLIHIESSELMAKAFLVMQKHGVRHIAVSENNKITGMLSIRNFSAYYVRKFSKRQS
ncbi:MAG: CBS domain-containing protein [Nitrospina sp.]|jgi:signal-transduction protein with cAMP-binding, CBS, and nucleotidyltransferase domain|nr:CBS domain-containing protein [Nitrospina sp.]MBT5028568.1 CBS domain-containing protein [Nitrospina sp.]MBT5867831.1 CBS domain-containing protein [Nitrospinaceae bacterium]MBT6345982.1 CBS domain-containing protein [Nitrospina sp.]